MIQKLCKRFLFKDFIKEYNYRAGWKNEKKKEKIRAEISSPLLESFLHAVICLWLHDSARPGNTHNIDRKIVKHKSLQLGQEIKEAEITNLPTSHSHAFLNQLFPKVLGPRIRTPNCLLL